LIARQATARLMPAVRLENSPAEKNPEQPRSAVGSSVRWIPVSRGSAHERPAHNQQSEEPAEGTRREADP
jgi:hypothetical protein